MLLPQTQKLIISQIQLKAAALSLLFTSLYKVHFTANWSSYCNINVVNKSMNNNSGACLATKFIYLPFFLIYFKKPSWKTYHKSIYQRVHRTFLVPHIYSFSQASLSYKISQESLQCVRMNEMGIKPIILGWVHIQYYKFL